MDCRDLRETISAFVDGEIPAEEAERVREHIASCPECRAVEARMRSLGDGVRQLRPPVPDGFRNAVFARLESEGALPPKRKAAPARWRRAAVPLAAAAALALVLLTSREAAREAPVPGPSTARIEAPAAAPRGAGPAGRAPSAGKEVVPESPSWSPPVVSSPFTPEEKEMIALLDLLSDPSSLDAGEDADALDLLDLTDDSGGRRGMLRKGSDDA